MYTFDFSIDCSDEQAGELLEIIMTYCEENDLAIAGGYVKDEGDDEQP